MMLKRNAEQRHVDLDSGRSWLPLEREWWKAREVLTCKYGQQGIKPISFLLCIPAQLRISKFRVVTKPVALNF